MSSSSKSGGAGGAAAGASAAAGPPQRRPPKGHRQKGAGTVIKDRPTVVTNDGVVLKCKFEV